MKESTRQQLIKVMREFATAQRQKIAGIRIEDMRRGYPFHRLVFPDQAILAARAERSIVTSMGTSLYPKLAATIASDQFNDIHTEFPISGQLNDAAMNMIAQIVTELRTSGSPALRVPNYPDELNAILGSPGGGQVAQSVTADLYIGDYTAGPLFIELKTPRPNLDMVAESKRKMLTFDAMMRRQDVTGAKAYLGLTYNPYLTRAKYAHSFTKKIMDMEHEVLIGGEMWDHIGGPGTFDELLDLIDAAQSSILGL